MPVSIVISIDGMVSERLGKYINDSPTSKLCLCEANCVMRKIEVDGSPYLCLFALEDIEDGLELRYNYGESGLSWRKVKPFSFAVLYTWFHPGFWVPP